MQAEKHLIDVEHLSKSFRIKKGVTLHAVEDVSFFIRRGETLGLVGESGCGKSTLGRAVLRLHEPTAGKIVYDGETLFDVAPDGTVRTKAKNMLPYRRRMQIIFQDPSASLDPRFTVGRIVAEPLRTHGLCKTKAEERARVRELLSLVGINPDYSGRYPHEFSGGQQQRVGIARALAVNPDFIVCDEPISALDVSIQSQIVNMLMEMQEKMHLTYLFIAHDLSVVRYISDRIGVMYLGSLVELADSNTLMKSPLHPYTQTLISAVPVPDPEEAHAHRRILLSGEVPSPINPPSGCRFRTRCPYATAECAESAPKLCEVETGHFVACHNIGKTVG